MIPRVHAIVMNPPYIIPPTAEARDAYRARYASASGQYGMGVCFTERAFELLVDGGFSAQITSNAFMKREYGKKYVEQVLPLYDLTHVLDTSGAYIPGHGTPTVILVTRNRPPTGAPVRCVMGRRGEPETPAGATPIGLTWAGALAKCAKTLTKEIADDAKLSRKDAAPIAAAWVTTAGALRLVDHLAGAMRDRVSDDTEHLGRSFARVAEMLPDADWWNPDTGINPCWRHNLTDAQSARVRAEVARVVDPRAVPAEQGGTDCIGDLYQGLDDAAREQHAFCQTPFFVAELLCDLGVEPALREFGNGATVLDPACGTGHLLVCAFQRLYRRRADPEDSPPEYTFATCARKALEQLHGVDINPVAVAIARFRLMLAYLTHADGIRRFSNVPDDLPVDQIVVGDALLDGRPEGYRLPSRAATQTRCTLFDLGAAVPVPKRARQSRAVVFTHKTTRADALRTTGDGESFGDYVEVTP